MNDKHSKAYIEALIEKYDLGKTSLAEEGELYAYFDQQEIAPDLLKYKPEFQALNQDFSALKVSEQVIDRSLALPQETKHPEKRQTKVFSMNRYALIAASVLMLLLSYMLGYMTAGNQGDIAASGKEDMQSLKQEMMSMKELMVQNFLDQKYNHQKLYALTMASQLDSVSGEILDKVFTTLNQDENVNIRLAAADMLYQFASYKEVQTGLVSAFESQESPLVILELLRLVKSLDDKTSQSLLDKIMNQENLKPTVKTQIENTYKSI